MAVSEELLKILVCPETKQPLSSADGTTLEEINQKIADRELRNRGGQTVEKEVDGILVREDGQVAYLIRDDVPIMLIEESVSLSD